MATHAVELPRVTSADVKALFADERRQLMQRAVAKLQYRIADTRTLLGKLAAIDILPFQTSAVNEYKKSKEGVGMWSGTRNWFLWLACQLSVVGLLIYAGFHAPWNVPGSWAGLECALLVIGGYIIVSFVGTIVCLYNCDMMVGTGRRFTKEWESVSLSHYTGVIPDHVLNTALQIQEAVPEATFSINYLQTTTNFKDRPVRDPDPFLFVKFGNESYYVEQWDERDFPRADAGVV